MSPKHLSIWKISHLLSDMRILDLFNDLIIFFRISVMCHWHAKAVYSRNKIMKKCPSGFTAVSAIKPEVICMRLLDAAFAWHMKVHYSGLCCFSLALVCFTTISFWTNFELHTRSYDCGGHMTVNIKFCENNTCTSKKMHYFRKNEVGAWAASGRSPGSATVWGFASLREKLFLLNKIEVFMNFP